MAVLRVPALLILCAMLMAPSALAGTGDGTFEADAIHLAPAATFAASRADILFDGPAGQLTLDLTDVAIHKIGTRRVSSNPFITAGSSDIDERATYTSARVTIREGTSGPIALRALGTATGTIGAATVRGVEGALLMALPSSTAEDVCAADSYGCIDVFGAYEIAGAPLDLALSGPFYIMLYGPTLVVEDEAGTQNEFTSGGSTSTDGLPGEDDAILVVRAERGAGTVLAENARLFSTAPTIRTAAVTLDAATGAVRVGAIDYRASRETVAAAGDVILTPGPVERAGTNRDAANAPIYASTMTTRLSGNIETIDLDGRFGLLDSTAETAGAAVLALALLAGAAYAWQHITFGAVALYTRLNKPEILENDVRSNIFDIIVQNPGISAREVHRRSEQSWGTVVYHLRQLERHHLVVSRALGRTRNYYENHGKYKGMEAQLACLQSDRARILASAIVAEPGITQEQLAIAVSLPQPTTSYYVRKLKQAGLVEEQRDGRYTKYVPHADLPRFLELSESSVRSGGAADSGVQG